MDASLVVSLVVMMVSCLAVQMDALLVASMVVMMEFPWAALSVVW